MDSRGSICTMDIWPQGIVCEIKAKSIPLMTSRIAPHINHTRLWQITFLKVMSKKYEICSEM